MKRLALCVSAVSAALVLSLIVMPRPALAQTGIEIVERDVVLTRTSYPPVKPWEGPVRIYAGEWRLRMVLHNHNIQDVRIAGWSYATNVTCRIFLDNVFLGHPHTYFFIARRDEFLNRSIIKGRSEEVFFYKTFPAPGTHEIRIEVWHGTGTTPHDVYRFSVLVVKAEVSNLQASSRVVRARGDNSLVVSFTNGGNENMRQAVLRVADSKGLIITPNSVELGDVRAGQSASAGFTVSSPAGVTLGTALPRFSLSFIDYAGIRHTEDVQAEVEVYRLSPTLTVSAPSSVGSGDSAQISAVLRDPDGAPIANKNVTLTVDGSSIGVFLTDSNGVAQTRYKFTEIGTRSIGASFAGSASYGASSASAELAVVTPTTPTWLLIVAACVVLGLVGGMVAYLKRRKPRRTFK